MCKGFASLTIAAQHISFLPSRAIFALLKPLLVQLNLNTKNLFSPSSMFNHWEGDSDQRLQRNRHCSIAPIKDALHAIIQGLIRNPTVTTPPLLVFIHMLIAPFFDLLPQKLSDGRPPPGAPAYTVIEFALALLLAELRQHRIDGRVSLHARMMAPFIPILLCVVGTAEADITTNVDEAGVLTCSKTAVRLSLRILTMLVKPLWGRIPALKNLNWVRLMNRVFALARVMEDSEMVRASFTFFIRLVQCMPGVVFSVDQIHLLLSMVSRQLDDVKARRRLLPRCQGYLVGF